MRQLIGICKFGAALLIIIGCIVSFTIALRKYEAIIGILTVMILASIFGLYIYYLLQTGLWNFKNKSYLINIGLVIGLLFHFIFIFAAFYYSSIYTKLALTTVPFAIIGLAIGTYDLKQFFQKWKSKKMQIP
jgi:hypothetical protein